MPRCERCNDEVSHLHKMRDAIATDWVCDACFGGCTHPSAVQFPTLVLLDCE